MPDDLIGRLPQIAELLTGRYRDRLAPCDLHRLELRIQHNDWTYQDIDDVREVLPRRLRWLLD
jgi:hypothetical protein